MKKLTFLLAAIMVFCFMAPAFAAPVFPDVPEEHWARDAVASLAANGIVEGYPDGTFKGDRAATRYEVAMVVARLLAKMEQENANFATKADLDELRKLVDQLRAELDALGVRVTNLEDAVCKLDRRVTELERITFYGELDSMFVSQGFTSCDMPLVFNGSQWVAEPAGYHNTTVGTAVSANYSPQLHSLMPSIDYRTGRPLTSGTGLTVTAKFGLTAKISEDVDAGLELAGHMAVGDPLVNMFYGVSAPYFSNAFTANGTHGFGIGVAHLSGNSPWTRVTLDNFWVKHKPSGIKLVAGSFGDMLMDPILFAGQPNPNVNGAQFLNNAGIKVSGTGHAISDLDWEVFYTVLPDMNVTVNNVADFSDIGTYGFGGYSYPTYPGMSLTTETGYNTHAYGGDINWHFQGGNFKVGYLRAVNDTVYGETYGPAAYGAGGVTANYLGAASGLNVFTVDPLLWNNPYAYNNLFFPEVSPIIGLDRSFGPQSTTNWSAHFDYTWECSAIKPRVFAEYAGSSYKPNKTVDYSVSGNALRAGLGITLANDTLDLDVEYKSVDPTYDPFILRYPVGVNSLWRLPSFSYFPNMYQLHDSDIYTNNRQGWTFKAAYRFKDEKGKLWAAYEMLDQKETSLYRSDYYTDNFGIPSLSTGIEPGFIEPFFRPFAIESYANSASSVAGPDFEHRGQLLDSNEKGKTRKFSIGLDYKFQNDLGLDANYYHQTFERDTALSVGQTFIYNGFVTNTWAAASQNYVNLKLNGLHLGLAYPFNEKFAGKLGFDYTTIKGHFDPAGVYNGFAMSTGSHSFDNIDVRQTVPSIGFDYRLSKNAEWGLDFKYFNTKDEVRLLNPTPVVGEVAPNPFSWKGTQVSTQFKVKF